MKHSLVSLHSGHVIDVSILCRATHWVQEDVTVVFLGCSFHQLDMSIVHRVSGLESYYSLPVLLSEEFPHCCRSLSVLIVVIPLLISMGS